MFVTLENILRRTLGNIVINWVTEIAARSMDFHGYAGEATIFSAKTPPSRADRGEKKAAKNVPVLLRGLLFFAVYFMESTARPRLPFRP
jgi:hypothetical protein